MRCKDGGLYPAQVECRFRLRGPVEAADVGGMKEIPSARGSCRHAGWRPTLPNHSADHHPIAADDAEPIHPARPHTQVAAMSFQRRLVDATVVKVCVDVMHAGTGVAIVRQRISRHLLAEVTLMVSTPTAHSARCESRHQA